MRDTVSGSIVVTIAAVCIATAAGAQTTVLQNPNSGAGGQAGAVVGGIAGSQLGPLPARDQAAQPAGTGRVSGIVTAGDTGRPLRRATVRLMGIGIVGAPGVGGPGGGFRTSSTDAEGRYEFTELPAGRYNVTATHTGYVQMSYGQKRPFAAGQPIVVQDGAATARVNIVLPAAGVIAGHVVDELGEPVADVFVMAMRRQFMGGERRLVGVGSQATTNDIGEFRLHSLAPGDYLISASLRGSAMGLSGTSGYATGFYPAATAPEQAQAVSVHSAETVSNIVVTLTPSRLNRVTGTVVGADGQPAQGGNVVAISRSGATVMSPNGMVRPDGSFEIDGVADGEYTLRAMLGPFGMPSGPPPRPQVATALVTVAGNDVSNVIVRPLQLVTIAGVITGDAAALALVRPGQLQVVAGRLSVNDAVGPQPGSVRVAEDLTFALPVYPGRIALRAMGLNGLLIESVRWNGTDVSRGFDLPEAANSSGFEIALTNRTAKLTISAVGAQGQPLPLSDVLVFSEDRDWWSVATPGRFANGRTNEQGRFDSPPLLPGTYYVVAIDAMEMFRAGDPEFLESMQTRAQRVSLAAGETREIQVKAIEP